MLEITQVHLEREEPTTMTLAEVDDSSDVEFSDVEVDDSPYDSIIGQNCPFDFCDLK